MVQEGTIEWWIVNIEWFVLENILPISFIVCSCFVGGFLFYLARKERIKEKQKNKSLKG